MRATLNKSKIEGRIIAPASKSYTIRGLMEDAGFEGYNEVEVFSNEYWTWEQNQYLELIKERYLTAS